jgi:hypothetical protein
MTQVELLCILFSWNCQNTNDSIAGSGDFSYNAQTAASTNDDEPQDSLVKRDLVAHSQIADSHHSETYGPRAKSARSYDNSAKASRYQDTIPNEILGTDDRVFPSEKLSRLRSSYKYWYRLGNVFTPKTVLGQRARFTNKNYVTTRDVSSMNRTNWSSISCRGREDIDLKTCESNIEILVAVFTVIGVIAFGGLLLVVLEALRHRRRKRVAPCFIDAKAGSDQRFDPGLGINSSSGVRGAEDDVERQMQEVPRECSEHRCTLDGTTDGWTNWITKNNENQVSSCWTCSNGHMWLLGPAKF